MVHFFSCIFLCLGLCCVIRVKINNLCDSTTKSKQIITDFESLEFDVEYRNELILDINSGF